MVRVRPLAIALALLCASQAPAQRGLEQRVRKALDRARPALLSMARQTKAGQHALVCLALAHDGVPLSDKRFRAAVDRLLRSELTRTYDLSLRLMVLVALPDLPDRRRRARRDLAALWRNQRNGGFSYVSTGGRWDLSNTQYAALGMRAAASLGATVSRQRWASVARRVLTARVYKGGFGYRPGNGPTTSMTVAGIAVLEVCAHQLNAPRSTLGKQMRQAIDAGWGYMERHRKTIGNGPGSQRDYYFHYGLERAAILSDRSKVGDVDWYQQGARMLLAQQKPGGCWGHRGTKGTPIQTAFAVLFLRRSFRRTLTGPITPKRDVFLKDLNPQADDKAVAKTAKLEIARGYRAVPDLIKNMRSPVLARRKVVALALPAITKRFHEFSPYSKPRRMAPVIKAAELWWLREGPALLKR